MNDVSDLEWRTDLGAMSCRNVKNDVVVGFERHGDELYGKIKSIPIRLFNNIDNNQNWEVMINNFILKASMVFLKEYEKNGAWD